MGVPLISGHLHIYIYIRKNCGYDDMIRILYDRRNSYYVKWENPESNAMRGRFLRIALV